MAIRPQPKKKQPVPPRAKKPVPKKQAQRKRPGPKGVNWRPAFLSTLARTGMITTAAEAAGIDSSTARRERRTNPNFAAEEKEAEAIAAEMLEAEAIRRGVHGLVQYQFTKDGTPILHPVTGEPYFILEYSDTLLSLLLKGRMPKKYRDKIEHSGEVEHKHFTLDEWKQRMAEAQA